MCQRIPHVHTLKDFSESSGPLFKSSCHFSLKNHFLLCMEGCFCCIHNPTFLLGQQSSLRKCSLKKEGARELCSETGVEWSGCEQHSLKWHRMILHHLLPSFSPFVPLNHMPVHMRTTHTHRPGHAHTCVHTHTESI